MPRALFLILLSILVPKLSADEGMWLYNRLPLEILKKEHDFRPGEELLGRLQRASVRLNNGGSGSFVSPAGLVMTNQHVASDCIRKLSSEKKDYVADGFYARSRSRELKCPDLELNVLVEIEEVTERVNRGVKPEMDEAAQAEARKAEWARIEKDCRDSTLMRCDVVELYQGGIFDLYKYQRFDDVRLVFAPEFQMAFFGGDPDNFTYPRFNLDVSFLRVYKEGRPIESPAYLPLAAEGAAEGDFVMVSGHPGSTQRRLTVEQLRYERDRRMPFMLEFLRGMAEALRSYGRGGEEAARIARDELFRFDNSIKAYNGMLAGLRDREIFDAKVEQEKKLRSAVEADAELKERFDAAWSKIAAAQEIKTELYEPYRLAESYGVFSRYFTIARHLYRLAEESKKPNEKRLPEYRDSGRESLEQQIYSPAPIYSDVEIAKLAQSLTFMRNRLGVPHPLVQKILKGRIPEDVARGLVEGTRLGDVEFRRQLGADDAAKAKVSDDAMIALAREIDEESRRIRKRYEDEVEAIETAHGARIAKARFAVYGSDVYPDATFTLRLAFGKIQAYLENHRRVAAFTVIEGLFNRATGEPPHVLPDRVLKAKRRLKLDTPLNLVSTNDITGGNSGSPLISRDGGVVGLIFDGNIQSLSNEFLYSERQARAVSVDVRGVVEFLRKAYGAERLAGELLPKP